MKRLDLFSIKVALIGSIGGLLFGYDLGVISQALPMLIESFQLTLYQQEMVTSSLMFGCIIGAMIGGWVADRYGRKYTIVFVCVIFILGSLTLTFSRSLEALLVGRVIVGIGVAISAIVDVAYLTEVSPTKYRGAIVGTNELMITIGLLLAYGLDYAFAEIADGWRLMFAMPLLMAFVWAMLMICMPESPKWLVVKGNKLEAYNVFLQRSEGEEEATSELEYAVTLNELMVANSEADSFWHWKYCLLVSIVLMIAQNFSGHACVLAYSVNFFEETGLKQYAGLATILLGLTKVVFTAFSMGLVDRVGRKVLLQIGVVGMIFGLFVLACFLPYTTSVADINNSTIDPSINESSLLYTGLCVAATCVLVASYAIGFGPVTFLVTSELFPDHLRGRAIGYSMVANWISSFLVVSTYLSLTSAIGSRVTFTLYLVSCIISMIFITAIVPETRDRSPNELQRLITQNSSARCCCCCKGDGAGGGQSYAPITVTNTPFELTQRHIDDSFANNADDL